MTAHIWVTHENCQEPHCSVCNGGIAICKVCGGVEGCLPTECPGERMSNDLSDQVYAGEKDFVGGAWVDKASENCPKFYMNLQKSLQYQKTKNDLDLLANGTIEIEQAIVNWHLASKPKIAKDNVLSDAVIGHYWVFSSNFLIRKWLVGECYWNGICWVDPVGRVVNVEKWTEMPIP